MASRKVPAESNSNTMPPPLTNAGQDDIGAETAVEKLNALLSEERCATRTAPAGQQPPGSARKWPFQDNDHPAKEWQVSVGPVQETAMNSASGAPMDGVGSG
jgi:hypothetical protein